MKRWSKTKMLELAQSLFAKHYKAKRLAHWNHDIHWLHRDKTWKVSRYLEIDFVRPWTKSTRQRAKLKGRDRPASGTLR